MTSNRYEFQTETKRLLDLMIHSLYSNRDIFLRELISNASDALDKRRFAAVTQPELAAAEELAIRLEVDRDARTLTISDNGIGMSREELIANIGTIARSGTRELAELLRQKGEGEARPELIGQFGVGFYSSFLVAERVVLVTRKVGEEAASRWESTGDGTYTVDDASRQTPGTSVTLHLVAADQEEGIADYADRWVLQGLIRRYSDFVGYPIRIAKEGDDGGEETLNSQKAIWTRPADEVTDQEYNEFYKHVSHDWSDPRLRIATKIEGSFEARALLFVPSRAPFDLYYRDMSRRGVQLYVKRVFIMDECEELLPSYLRFVKGVVDAEDLPLNVSRELLQQNRQVQVIRKHLVKKVLDALVELKRDDAPGYREFWRELGPCLKEGLLTSGQREERVLELVITASTRDPDAPTSLAEYVERMKEGQESIYYLTGQNLDTLRRSPHLEAFRERGIEVLFFTDQVDEIWLQQRAEYQDKKLVSVLSAEVPELEKAEESSAEETTKDEGAASQELDGLLMAMRAALQEQVKEVRVSKRLTTSATCLVTAGGDLTPQMERLMKATGQSIPTSKRILEVNPRHPVVEKLAARHSGSSSDPLIGDYAKLLYGQAVLAEGGALDDPSAFVQLMSELMARAA